MSNVVNPSGPAAARPSDTRVSLGPWLRLLVVSTFLAGAVSAAAETLADAVGDAYERNPILMQQRFRQRQVMESYVQARAQYGPTINLQAGGTLTSLRSGGQTTNGDTAQIATAISQPLYTAGQLRNQLAAAHADVIGGEEQLRLVEQQTVQTVIVAYAAVIRDTAGFDVARENVAVLGEQLTENRARRHFGDVTLTDVGQADARLAAAQAGLANAVATLAISRGQYRNVVGHDPGALSPLPNLVGIPLSADAAFAAAERDSPAVLAAQDAERSSSAAAAAARGTRGPSIALTGQAIYSNRPLTFDSRSGQREFVGGLTLSQPLFSAGAISSRIRAADDRNDGDQAAVAAARRDAVQAVTIAWSQLAAARAALGFGTRQVASAQLAFAGMRREALNGLRSTIEALNAEQDLQSAQLNLLQTRYAEYVARAQLLIAIGRLDAASIAPSLVGHDAAAEFAAMRDRGRTPLEGVAMALDRLGSAAPRRRVPLTAEAKAPDTLAEYLPPPGAELTQAPLTPITRSRLVPAGETPFDAGVGPAGDHGKNPEL